MHSVESRVRVRYAETDQMGVVYHANYLKYFERAREHVLGALDRAVCEGEAGHGPVPASALRRPPWRHRLGARLASLGRRHGAAAAVVAIGVGEGIDDLQPFNAEEFVDALLDSTA